MKLKKYNLILLVVLFILIISGCSSKPNSNVSEDILKKEVGHWSSPEFKGRLTGTTENNTVRDQIADQFEQIGLKPVQTDNFKMPFEMPFYNPKDIKKSFVVMYKNGEYKEFVYGKDWLEQQTNYAVMLDDPISFTVAEDKVLVTEALNLKAKEIRAQLVKTPKFHKIIAKSDVDYPTIQISPTLYDFLEENKEEIQSIQLVFSGRARLITAYNVVGKIPNGKQGDKKQAIILSAHFDHVGTAGKNTYLGSVDNATGLTGLIKLASILKEVSEKQSFDSDVLFAAFNGEESGLFGSAAFVKQMENKYSSMININIDSIGIKDGGRISFTGEQNGSKLLSDSLQKITKEKRIEYDILLEDGANVTSDHVSFLNANYNAINISQEHFDKIHTTDDNLSYVDTQSLQTAIEIVKTFVEEYDAEKFKIAEKPTSNLLDEMNVQKKYLSFGEYKTFLSQNTRKVEMASNLERQMSERELKDIQSSIKDQSFDILNTQVMYKLKNQKELKIDEKDLEKVKKFNRDQYKLGSIDLILERQEKQYFISLFEDTLKDFGSGQQIEQIGDWKLLASKKESAKDPTYNMAISTLHYQNKDYTILLQNYDESKDISTESFSRNDIEYFISSFNPKFVIEAFY